MAAIITITATDAEREPIGELHTGDPRDACWNWIVATYGPQSPYDDTRDANGFVVGSLALVDEWIQASEGERQTLCLPL